jgi:hypothetical protein
LNYETKSCRLGKSPHRLQTHNLFKWEREALTAHLVTLAHLQNAADIANHEIAPSRITCDNEAEFDNLDDLDPPDEDTPAALGSSHLPANTNAIPVEEQQVYLLCNGAIADVEINLQNNQASQLLHQLWELIADKSFQYLHII